MEIMFSEIFNHLNIMYIFMCNVLTYIIISCCGKDISTGWKRLISTIVALALGAVCIFWMHYDHEAIFCSFFVQYLMYDYVIKWFINKLNTGTKDVTVGGE